jgi:ABC-type Fe3+-hydroxamate transport system substrate-binding protein
MSWVIVEKATGRVVCELRSAKLVKALNTETYKAVPKRAIVTGGSDAPFVIACGSGRVVAWGRRVSAR